MPYCRVVNGRLTRMRTFNVPGLTDLDIELQPLTALIGPRGSGKSRLLAALAWLLTGGPVLGAPIGAPGAAGATKVSAEIYVRGRRRWIERVEGAAPSGDLPSALLLTARERLSPLPGVAPAQISDASQAEALADLIAQRTAHGNSEILLIEEPELMLTPQQQRYLYESLRAHGRRGQVVYSTRSPAMLDAVHHNEIVRLDLTAAGLAVRRAPHELLTDEERLRLAAEFDHERAEMFFATAVVLVEGQTERQSLPIIFRTLGHDPDRLGISIVEMGGKGNLVLGARLLAQMRIPHVIVHDSDRGRAGAIENAAIRQSAGEALVFVLDPDFEAVAGIRSHDDKVLHAWQHFRHVPAGRVPEIFRQIVETTVRLARPSA